MYLQVRRKVEGEQEDRASLRGAVCQDQRDTALCQGGGVLRALCLLGA